METDKYSAPTQPVSATVSAVQPCKGVNPKMDFAGDLENQYDRASLESDGPADPLLQRKPEVIELDDIPALIQPNDNTVLWAVFSDERCMRRVGLTASEARLFRILLQTDTPEDYPYEDLKAMFDNFGREQKRLEVLVKAVSWWNVRTWRARSIAKARLQWLARMWEARFWLMYLLARRRRILKMACDRILRRLKEKRTRYTLQRNDIFGPESHSALQQEQQQPAQRTIDEAIQTSPAANLHDPTRIMQQQHSTSLESDQASDIKLHIIQRIRSGLIGSTEVNISRSRDLCPVFEDRIEATRKQIRRQVERLMPPQGHYIVIGRFVWTASDPHERLVQFENPEELFKAIRKAERDLRGYHKYISLRGLRGFGLYKCDISRGAHIPLTLNASQKSVLYQLHLAYQASYRHHEEHTARAWQGWVHKNLNHTKNNPLQGLYSLQLIYDWSSYRLIVAAAVPLLLSLAIGFWYMKVRGDVVAAWTLSLYIVTAAAALIALMAIVGSLKDI